MVLRPVVMAQKFCISSLQMTVYSSLEKRIHGAKASRTAIVDILNHYELASGQKINYKKSEVSFSKRFSIMQREELTNILSMWQVEKHEKYLGIPSISGRSKKTLFDSLFNRIWKKLQG